MHVSLLFLTSGNASSFFMVFPIKVIERTKAETKHLLEKSFLKI